MNKHGRLRFHDRLQWVCIRNKYKCECGRQLVTISSAVNHVTLHHSYDVPSVIWCSIGVMSFGLVPITSSSDFSFDSSSDCSASDELSSSSLKLKSMVQNNCYLITILKRIALVDVSWPSSHYFLCYQNIIVQFSRVKIKCEKHRPLIMKCMFTLITCLIHLQFPPVSVFCQSHAQSQHAYHLQLIETSYLWWI